MMIYTIRLYSLIYSTENWNVSSTVIKELSFNLL